MGNIEVIANELGDSTDGLIEKYGGALGMPLPEKYDGALGMPLPEDMRERVTALQAWAASEGQKAECALFCAFWPAIAEIDRKARESSQPYFNPRGVADLDLVQARQTLIRVRDSFLMPSMWDAELVVLFSHTIKSLYEILSDCLVTGLETDGVGEETG